MHVLYAHGRKGKKKAKVTEREIKRKNRIQEMLQRECEEQRAEQIMKRGIIFYECVLIGERIGE